LHTKAQDPKAVNELAERLTLAGWDDAGRDCWVKTIHASAGPALVLRWASELTQADLLRLLQHTAELTAALVAARNAMAQQGDLFEDQPQKMTGDES